MAALGAWWLYPHRNKLHARLRLFVGVVVNIGFLVYSVAVPATEPADFSRGLVIRIHRYFWWSLLPTTTVVLLAPVIVAGTMRQRVAAVLLCIYPTYIAWWTWSEIISTLSQD